MRPAMRHQVISELEIVLGRIVRGRAALSQAGVAAHRHYWEICESQIAREQRNIILRGEIGESLEGRVVELDARISKSSLVHNRGRERVRFGQHDTLRRVFGVDGEWRN